MGVTQIMIVLSQRLNACIKLCPFTDETLITPAFCLIGLIVILKRPIAFGGVG